MKSTVPVSVLELRRLLIELNDKRPDICFRFRFLGEMWKVHFMRIVQVSEKGLILHDEVSDTQILVPDLSAIIQFELDNGYQNYEPHFHYEVKPAPEFKVC
jgi:hypothetical protein